jgi:hypothetical protein
MIELLQRLVDAEEDPFRNESNLTVQLGAFP